MSEFWRFLTAYFLGYAMLSFPLFCAFILYFSFIGVWFLNKHVSVVNLIIFNIFQEYEGDFKPNINPSYIPNDVKGDLTSKCYNCKFVNILFVFVLNFSVKYFNMLYVFTFLITRLLTGCDFGPSHTGVIEGGIGCVNQKHKQVKRETIVRSFKSVSCMA